MTVKGKYSNGIIVLSEPLELESGTEVELTVRPLSSPPVNDSDIPTYEGWVGNVPDDFEEMLRADRKMSSTTNETAKDEPRTSGGLNLPTHPGRLLEVREVQVKVRGDGLLEPLEDIGVREGTEFTIALYIDPKDLRETGDPNSPWCKSRSVTN
jgi:predicted DNA-binding antitoxin AbrB/MazE fold protein